MSVTVATDISDRLDAERRKRDELRGVIAMSVPIVITLCSRMLMDIADFKMISHLPERASEAQAAMLPAQITLWTFVMLGMATISIINTFVSQSLGRGRPKDAATYAWQGFYLSIAFGAVGLSLRPLLPTVFGWIGHGPDVQTLELTYARISILTIGPTVAAEAFAGFFNGVHRPKVTMWSAIEANLINVAISVVLIFGLLGFPAMGIAGAAWGTFVGVVYRLVRLMATFLSRSFAKTYGTRETRSVDFKTMRAIVRVGLPQGLQSTSDVFVWMFFVNVLTGKMFGETALIASNVAWQYLRLAFMPAFGIGIALSAMVGKAIGQRDYELAMRVTRLSLGILLVYLVTLSLVYFVFRHALIGWFNDSPEVVRIGASVMICAAIFQAFDGAGIGFHAALKGAGDTLWPAVLLITSHWAIVVGGGYAMARLFPQWGIVGPWAAASALIIFLCFALWYRWHGRAWQRVDIFKHEKRSAPSEECRTQG